MMMMEEKKTCTNSVVHSNGSHLEPRLEPTKHLLDLEDQAPINLARCYATQGEGRERRGGAIKEPRRAIRV